MLQKIIFDIILYFSNPKIASYLGNKGTWDECRFRKTHHSCFLFQNQPYDLSWSYPSFTFVLFILIFTLKGWSTKSQNFFTRRAFNHTTQTHTYEHTHTYIQSMILNNDAFEPANAFEVKKKTENVFALWWMVVWWVHHVQFIVYTITISRLEARLENLLKKKFMFC